MKERVVSSLAQPVGNHWKNLQARYTKEGNFFVASPLSSTPLPIYKWIIDHAHEFANWDKVCFVLMDEQLEGEKSPFTYVSVDDPASYEGFAKKHFLNPLREKTDTEIPVVKPEVANIEQFDTEIDLLILAIGVLGNYANVMPETAENTGWHAAHLLPEFNQYHESASYSGLHFREYGMSIGPKQVLSAKNVVVIISGEKKKDLAKELLTYDSFHPEFPLSIIHHPNLQDRVEVYLTEDAL